MKCFSSLIEIDLYGWSTGTTCSLLLYIFDSESHTGGDSALSSSSSFCECSKRCSAQKNVTDQIVLIGSSGAVFSGSVWICSCRVANFRSVSNLSFNGSCPRSSRFQKAVSQQLNEYRISLHSVYCAASPVSLQEIPFHGRLGVARNLFYGGIKLLILIVDSVTTMTLCSWCEWLLTMSSPRLDSVTLVVPMTRHSNSKLDDQAFPCDGCTFHGTNRAASSLALLLLARRLIINLCDLRVGFLFGR